jgi:hypothetical protein
MVIKWYKIEFMFLETFKGNERRNKINSERGGYIYLKFNWSTFIFIEQNTLSYIHVACN